MNGGIVLYVVTHPFVHSVRGGAIALQSDPSTWQRRFPVAPEREKQLQEAWDGHKSGPFTDRSEAERACTAALATGMFFQVEIKEERRDWREWRRTLDQGEGPGV